MYSLFSLILVFEVSINVINKMGPRTTIGQRELVIHHFKNGQSQRKIAEIVNINAPTVQKIIERFVHENRVHNKGREPPNKIFSDTDERTIVRRIKASPRLSAPKLTSAVQSDLGKQCSVETVRRILRKHDFHGRVARKGPFISPKNRLCRLRFANEHVSETSEYWNSVIFADESKFNIFGSDGMSYVWRKPNKELNKENLKPTMKHGGGSVMVWACMSAAGTGRLTFIETTMDKFKYLQILKDNLLQSAEDLGIKSDFRFYQDNDPKHKAGIVQSWLIYNCPHLMTPPPQSPDLNVIENLWSILETNIRKHKISNKNDLKEALKTEWTNISPDITKKLVTSMQNRLKSVIDNKGYHTKY